MKICIPVISTQTSGKHLLAHDFYKANYYCLFDLNKNESEYFSKSDLMNRFGLDLRATSGEDKINAIISPNMRPMAYKILSDNKVTIYRPASNLVEENIELFKDGNLSLFDPSLIESPSCNSSCSSCSSTTCSSVAS